MTVTEPRHTDAWSAASHEQHRPHRSHEPEPDHCAQCHAPLAQDQEWCLECGSARTLIYAAPDWRVPVVVALVVIVIMIAGFAFAITRLSDNSASAAQTANVALGNASQSGSSPAGASSGSGAQAASVNADGASAKPGTIAAWPVGLSGWTVVVDRYTAKTDAYSRARVIAPTGTPVGVFNSDEHPAMKPGFWIVFSGRFPNRYEAQLSAAHLVAEGYTTAIARQVAKPGGL